LYQTIQRKIAVRLIERRSPSRWQAAMQAVEVYSVPRSAWKMVPGMRRWPRVATAAWSAAQSRAASWWMPLSGGVGAGQAAGRRGR
jgi:hypothetical protein